MAWDAGVITSSTPWAALSTKLKNLVGTAGVENWGFVENIPAGTGSMQSGSTSYSLDVFRCRGSATLYKPITWINLGNTGSPTDAASYVQAIATPAINKFITVFVFNTAASAAADPTSVTLDGSNAPTFTKIKSQASADGSTVLKCTLWIAKTGSSAPTGTNLTVTFGSTQTGCGIITDQWDGIDLTLGADGVDPTGATKIAIQATGANGTATLANGATLAPMLGIQSVAISWAACENTSGNVYSAEAGWIPTAADNALVNAPATHARGQVRPYQDDLTGTLTLAGATASTAWSAIALEFQKVALSTSVTHPNDAGKDFYFIIEIPVPDNGTLGSVFNSAEDYDLAKFFNRMPPAFTNTAGVSPGVRSDTFAQYTSWTGNNRAQLSHQILNTTGFNYFIKLTPNAVMFATRVAASENSSGAMLLDSFATNATDFPLINVCTISAGNTMSRTPGIFGVTFSPSNGWECETFAWTAAASKGICSNATGAQDPFSSNKIHVARIFVGHAAGNTAANIGLYGYARGLWKSDFLCFTRGGTVQLGDTMTIAGNTWTVIHTSPNLIGTGAALLVVTRAI